MPDRVGQTLGHYRLTSLLGHGGFADVYLGEHIYLGTFAAIKILDMRLSQDEIEQFRNEARTIARLEHPHIVHVFDFGVEEHTPFLVMSYAPNGSLRQRYPKGSRLPLTTILSYVKQIADALQYAHNERLIHRDVKPENMLFGRNDEILLGDFGLATIASSSSQKSSRDVSGTITYMAPEQARGRPHIASDQYALGIVVYEWLSGSRPFNGTYEEIAIQHALHPPPPLHKSVPAISPAIEAVVLRALEKDPHRRFASIQDFTHALEQACLASSETTVVLSSSPSSTAPLQAESFSTDRSYSDVIYTVAWSPDRRHIAYGGHDRTVQVRGATTGASSFLYRGHTASVTTIAWSPDGQKVASAGLDKTIQIWSSTTGQKIATYDGHSGMIYALAWSPDSKRIASSSSGANNTVHVWDASTGHNLFTYRGHSYWIRALDWSPDGKQIASGSWREVQLWDSANGRKLFTYRGHHSWVRIVAWSPDGSQLASAGEDKTAQVWEPTSKANKWHIIATHNHADWIGRVLWSPNGTYIATASKDNMVHVWDATTARQIFTHQIRSTTACAIAWMPDCKHLVSASGDGSVHVWQVA